MEDKSLKDITKEIETFKKYHQAKEVLIRGTKGRLIKYENVIAQIADSYIYIWKKDDTMLQIPVERLHQVTRDEKAAEMWTVMNALQFNEDMMRPISYWIRFSSYNKDKDVQ